MSIRFDDSLSALASAVNDIMGASALGSGVALRDAGGKLAFFVDHEIDDDFRERLGRRLRESLGRYARTDRVVAGSNDFGAERVLNDPQINAVPVNIPVVGERFVRVVDRRVVGADWLRSPAPGILTPPRFVFASMKGGVGRSTALAVAASHLASQSKRVLAVDGDMEAPGLGAMLLEEEKLPPFGLIDALVEGKLAPLDREFFVDMVGSSKLAQEGVIDVVPAFGKRSLDNPGNVLAKISRAYMEGVQDNGGVATILDQVAEILNGVMDTSRYDAVLFDARAGLHETAASAILGLGAEVFLFARDEPQTFQGYRALLGHMAGFLDPSGRAAPEWLSRLTMVQATAPVDADERKAFRERCEELFEISGIVRREMRCVEYRPSAEAPRGNDDAWNDGAWNDDAVDDADLLPDEDWRPRPPISILFDDRYRGADFFRRRDLLSREAYRTTFGGLLDHIDQTVEAASVVEEK